MIRNIALTLLLVLIFGCSSEQQAADSSQPNTTDSQRVASLSTPAAATSEKPNFNLVFFLDPNGGPCKMQDSILLEMSEELKGKVNIRYVKTTVPDDRNLFYNYGIRALPTLLLADASGKEIKRMPPGVKNAADVRALIQPIPRT
jgi:thioredoxin 1